MTIKERNKADQDFITKEAKKILAERKKKQDQKKR